MREIEFRAWDKKINGYMAVGDIQWCVGGLWVFGTGVCIGDNKPGDNKIVLEQYTGIRDKHGKKIFEGDRVDRIFEDGVMPCVVKASKYCPRLELLPIDGEIYGRYCHFLESNESQLEVVGTIHD